MRPGRSVLVGLAFKVLISILLVGLMSGGCKVVKKQKSSSESEKVEQTETVDTESGTFEIFKNTVSKKTTDLNDNTVTTTMIIPEGPITIHADGTFEGNAASVETKVERKVSKYETDSTNTVQTVAGDTTDHQSAVANVSESKKEKHSERESKPAWFRNLLFIGGLAVVISFLFYAWKKRWFGL